MSAIVPIPRCDVSVRPATPGDVPFIERLQRENRKSVGFLALSWIEGKIKAGQVLVAEDPHPNPPPEYRERECRLGYIISQDKYLHREELGLVVQLCVDAGAQRKFVGMSLLRAAFERAAYGCTLFCCWCAQDIEANRFWESMGFVPLAYRGGSEKKNRVHIFWQKRIREGDTTTKWWYPTETRAGAMGAARLVFPIPPDRHWSEEMPVILPGGASTGKQITSGEQIQKPKPAMTIKPAAICRTKTLFFTPPKPEKTERVKAEKKPKAKNDPKLVAAARDLRDCWLERLNEIELTGTGKYDVSRILPGPPAVPRLPRTSASLLPAA